MVIEKEKFFEIIRNVSESEGLNKDNLLERIGSKLKGVNPEAYSTYNNLKIDKLFMIQDLDKIASYTLLHLAVECNSVPIVKLLLEKKVKVDEQISGDVNSKFTALHIAALHGHQEMVQLLLDANANPSLKDSQGRTPRDMVSNIPNKDIIVEMLKEGEQRYAEARKKRLTYGQGTLLQPNNKTPGNLAVGGNKITAAVQAWNAKGQGENNGTTPNNRKIYVQNENEQTSSNSIINENNTDKVGDTLEREQAKRDAVAQKLQEAEQRFANNRKCIEQPGHNQHSEQYGATYNGEQTFLNKSSSDESGIYFDADKSEALSQSILEDGEDIYAQDENGMTPLHHAAANGDIKTAKYLIDNGADVNAQDKDSVNPLHCAVENNNKELAKLLIKHGADVDARNRNEHTPLHYAATHGYVEIAKYLIDKRANVNAQDQDEHIPLYFAVKNDNKELAKLLIKHGADRSLIKDEGLIIDRLNSMCGQLSEVVSGTSSHSKTHNATETPEETEKVRKRKVKLKKLCAQLKEENQSLKQKIQELGNENATLKDKLDKTESQYSKAEALLEKTQKELEESKSCIAGHETKLKQLNKENELLKQEIKNLKNENTPLKGELGKTKTNEVSLEKVGKRQFSPKVVYASLAAMLVVGAALSIASGLSALLIVAASVVSALIAGGITYTISKPIAPDTELKEVDIGSAQRGVCKT
ncbi:ankyrin repeat domain-containing protein [Wolbachia endosymbiont (group A) of Rhinocyllus conicus]|uniref:ankyrin repeat domain-containing protein n=1 Tax=Wolbachia endosymbiont (group A) of Rhinocyllus conicus TaxID=2954053 RepID=UPI002225FE42|nr:ankyrin repeat domain-containing protein [Wolbachia endosymbiont (group A) of Rhinocyllus conicus]